MMEWSVVKTGAEMFDALHAYGLGILVASATKSPVDLKDDGAVYKLRSPARRLERVDAAIVDEVLRLPTVRGMAPARLKLDRESIRIRNFDGLLVACFTIPGTRLMSVMDIYGRQASDPEVAKQALGKVTGALRRWKNCAIPKSGHSRGWLVDLLEDYDSHDPKIPIISPSQGNQVIVPMTVDPSFSYSTRNLLSDGLITSKSNVGITGVRYASFLSLIGAARFLRAQRVADHFVLCFLPLAARIELQEGTALPILPRFEGTKDHAQLVRWLTSYKEAPPGSNWGGLSYQVLQTQGAMQSISVDRGCLEYAWLAEFKHRGGGTRIESWRRLLSKPQEQIPFEVQNLLDCLRNHRADLWMGHLRDVALTAHNPHPKSRFGYGIEELKELTNMMTSSTPEPLSTVLKREKGTLRFGHALRLLGRFKPSLLHDLIGELDSVQARDQLLRILARAAQECVVARARAEFILIPDDVDLKYLLDDVEQFTAHSIASLLIILSALNYPRGSEQESSDRYPEPLQSQTAGEQVQNEQ